MKKRYIVITALFLSLTGCINPLGNSKTETTTSKATENIVGQQNLAVERISKSAPPPSLKISVPSSVPAVAAQKVLNNTNAATPANAITIEIPSPSEDQLKINSDGKLAAIGTSSNDYSLIKDISTGGKLILLAIGIALLATVIFFVVRILKKNSLAAAAAFAAADKGMAIGVKTVSDSISSAVRNLRDKAQASTDPKEIASLTSVIANLEADQGKGTTVLEKERGKLASSQP